MCVYNLTEQCVDSLLATGCNHPWQCQAKKRKTREPRRSKKFSLWFVVRRSRCTQIAHYMYTVLQRTMNICKLCSSSQEKNKAYFGQQSLYVTFPPPGTSFSPPLIFCKGMFLWGLCCDNTAGRKRQVVVLFGF